MTSPLVKKHWFLGPWKNQLITVYPKPFTENLKKFVKVRLTKDVKERVKKIKEMPGLTDQARRVVLKFYDQYKKTTFILVDLITKKPQAGLILVFSVKLIYQIFYHDYV